MIVTTIGREVVEGSRTSIFCNFTQINHPVTVVWEKKGTILEAANGIVAAVGDFESNFQSHTLDIMSARADATYTCKVSSANYPKEAEKEKSIRVSVFSK